LSLTGGIDRLLRARVDHDPFSLSDDFSFEHMHRLQDVEGTRDKVVDEPLLRHHPPALAGFGIQAEPSFADGSEGHRRADLPPVGFLRLPSYDSVAPEGESQFQGALPWPISCLRWDGHVPTVGSAYASGMQIP